MTNAFETINRALATKCPFDDCEYPPVSWKCRIWIDESAVAKEWREKVKNGRWPVEKVSE